MKIQKTFFGIAVTLVGVVAAVNLASGRWSFLESTPAKGVDIQAWEDIVQGKLEDSAGEKWTLFSQSGLTRYATFSENEKGVDITTLEKWGGVRYWWNKAVSTSFGIQHIVARHANDCLVAGVSSSGQLVVERWTITPPLGALSSYHEATTESIGVPVPVIGTTVHIEGRGAFISPGERAGPPIAQRATVFEGLKIGPLKAIVFDPEGRFALCQESLSGDVFQVVLSDGSFSKILEASNYPYLATHELYGVIEDGLGGRIFPVGTRLEAQFDGWMVLTDSDNDGHFDTPISLSLQDFEVLYPTWQIGGTWETVQ